MSLLGGDPNRYKFFPIQILILENVSRVFFIGVIVFYIISLIVFLLKLGYSKPCIKKTYALK